MSLLVNQPYKSLDELLEDSKMKKQVLEKIIKKTKKNSNQKFK